MPLRTSAPTPVEDADDRHAGLDAGHDRPADHLGVAGGARAPEPGHGPVDVEAGQQAQPGLDRADVAGGDR